MPNRQFSRRDFFGASALGAVAGAAVLANPVRVAAEMVGAKPADLPDLTITEVKVYVTNLGTGFHRINSPESGEIVSLVTASGIEAITRSATGCPAPDGLNTPRRCAWAKASSTFCRRWSRA